MNTLANSRFGRVLLHTVCLFRNRAGLEASKRLSQPNADGAQPQPTNEQNPKNTLMKTRIIRLTILLALLVTANSGRCAERFAGHFTGEGLTIEAHGDQDNYTGTITLGEDAFKFTARDKEEGVAGSFTTPNGQFDFQCVIKGDTLTLTSGNTRYKLTRVNPLAKGKTSNGSGAKLKSFLRQHGSGFLGQFARSVANSKGQVSGSATAAGFSTLASIGHQLGGSPPQNSSASSQPGVPLLQIPGAPFQPGAMPAITANTPSVNDPHAHGLPGTWVKIEQSVVNGVASVRPTFAVFRS